MSSDVTERQWTLERQMGLLDSSHCYIKLNRTSHNTRRCTQNCLCAALEMSNHQMQVILCIITAWITDWISSLLLVPLGRLRAEAGGFICSQIKGHRLPVVSKWMSMFYNFNLRLKCSQNTNQTHLKCVAAQQSHKHALSSPSLMSPNNSGVRLIF